jgi:hypothetical protein
MIARRYMHASGATSRDFGAISVADRRHAAKNPKAYFYEKPITIEDHQNSRWIAEPLRLLDCCQETDGAVAIVVTTAERAKDLKHRPAVIEAAAQGSGVDQYTMVSYYRPELGLPEMGLVGISCGRSRACDPPISRPRSSMTTSPRSPSSSWRNWASARGVTRRISSPTAPSRSAAGCRSTPTVDSSVRPTSTA